MLLLLLLLLLTHLRARARISPESPKLETTRSLLIFGRAYYRKDICVLDLAGGGLIFVHWVGLIHYRNFTVSLTNFLFHCKYK